MSGEINFKAAESADQPLIIPFMEKFYQLDNYPFDPELQEKALADLIAAPGLGEVWLIRERETTIGYLVVCLGYSLEYRGRDAFIDEIFIEESYRNRGIGRQAMEFIDQRCLALGVKVLHLEVEKDKENAQALYRKSGFADRGRYLLTKYL